LVYNIDGMARRDTEEMPAEEREWWLKRLIKQRKEENQKMRAEQRSIEQAAKRGGKGH